MDHFKEILTPQTSLVSIMAVNNEIGVSQPITEIGNIPEENVFNNQL